MPYTVLWTALPNGFTSQGRARISLMASPRPVGTQKLSGNELLKWPTIVNGFGRELIIAISDGTSIPASVTSAPADQALWSKLFNAESPVGEDFSTTESGIFENNLEPAYSYSLTHDTIKSLYQDSISRNLSSSTPDQGKLRQLLRGLAKLSEESRSLLNSKVEDLLDPQRLTHARIQQAIELLASNGDLDAAAALPLAPLIRRTGLTSKKFEQTVLAPTPLGGIRSAKEAEFGQVVGSIIQYPELARRLGLRIDLEFSPFSGTRFLRVTAKSGAQLGGTKPLVQPWSHVECSPATKKFAMVSDNVDGAEIVNGMLNLADEGRYTVSTLDVAGITEQLLTRAISPSVGSENPESLPYRRTVGFTVAQRDRVTKHINYALSRSARFNGPPPDEVSGAPVLKADDVTVGYRVDVSVDGTPFKSIMRSVSNYTVGTGLSAVNFSEIGEGVVDGAIPVQQIDASGVPHLILGEEVFGYSGWSLAAPMPGPVVGAETASSPHVIEANPVPIPGYPLRVVESVEPGTLPKLRFGRSYRFRARSVDLAGNSVEIAQTDTSQATPAVTFRRQEPVSSPVVVARRRFSPGESLLRLVVRSDGDGNIIGNVSERHLAAPKSSQYLAELHGAFDEAFGPAVAPAVRDRLLEVGKREQGSWLDPKVIDPFGILVPAAGIEVAGIPPVSILPVPQGSGLKTGEYIVHNSDAPILPYLPDVASSGMALKVPWSAGLILALWDPSGKVGLQSWPGYSPIRLIVQGVKSGSASSRVEVKNNRHIVSIDLPPGFENTMNLSSTISDSILAVMEAIPDTLKKAAINGQNPILSPSQEITLVHAVKKPPTPATIVSLSAGFTSSNSRGSSQLNIYANCSVDPKTMSKVAVEAVWSETVDRGYGPVSTEERRIVAASVDVAASNSIELHGKLDFGDTKHRKVRYRTAATTRFAEYFDIPAPGSERDFVREGSEQIHDRLATAAPKTPKVHSVVPIFSYSREVTKDGFGPNTLRTKRVPEGFRVYLKRPWCTSGEGELLGVVVAKDQVAGSQIVQNPQLAGLLTRWGTDPYEDRGVWTHITESGILGGVTVSADKPLIMLKEVKAADAGLFRVVGVPVAFDPVKNLWYADIKFLMQSNADSYEFPFLQLSLVAFQPMSAPMSSSFGELQTDERVSRIVQPDMVQLPPVRRLQASRVGDNVTIGVTGNTVFGGKVQARWQRRMFEPANKPPRAREMCIDVPDIATVSAAEVSASNTLCNFTISCSNSTAPRADLYNGRIVVEEFRTGVSAVEDVKLLRPLWVEIVDLYDLS